MNNRVKCKSGTWLFSCEMCGYWCPVVVITEYKVRTTASLNYKARTTTTTNVNVVCGNCEQRIEEWADFYQLEEILSLVGYDLKEEK